MVLDCVEKERGNVEARDLDLEKIRPVDLHKESTEAGSTATPFSTFIFAVVAGDMATAEAQIADDIVYHLNSEGKIDFMRQYLDTGSVWAQLK